MFKALTHRGPVDNTILSLNNLKWAQHHVQNRIPTKNLLPSKIDTSISHSTFAKIDQCESSNHRKGTSRITPSRRDQDIKDFRNKRHNDSTF